MSNGRAGWNIVTSFHHGVARNFGVTNRPNHTERYDRGDESSRCARPLGQLVGQMPYSTTERAGSMPERIAFARVNHEGEHYTSRLAQPAALAAGPAPCYSAGSSDTGRNFAARHAEAVFTAHLTRESAQAFYRTEAASDCRGPVAGPDPDPAGLSPMIAALRGGKAHGARARRPLRCQGQA